MSGGQREALERVKSDPVDEMPREAGGGKEVKTMNGKEIGSGNGSAMFIQEN